MSFEIRSLTENDIPDLRRLEAAAPDIYVQYVLDCFPQYYEAVSILEPPAAYLARQITVLGAFKSDTLVGAVGLMRVPETRPEFEDYDSTMEMFNQRFTEHDLNVLHTLSADLERTYIGAPSGSLLINGLLVSEEHRRQGIAKELLTEILNTPNEEFEQDFYIEICRNSKIQRLLKTLNFGVVKKTFSFSGWLQFSSWGSVLMKRTEVAD